MALFSPSAKIPRSAVIKAWNQSAETIADVQKLLKSVRVQLQTRQVVDLRRQLLEMTSVLSQALKDRNNAEGMLTRVNRALDLIDSISRELEKLLKIDKIDKDRLNVVIGRLGDIRRTLMPNKSSKRPKGIIMD